MLKRLLLPLILIAAAGGCSRDRELFTVRNARAHVDMLAGSIGSRPSGTDANARARAYIVDQLRVFGYQVRVQETDARRQELVLARDRFGVKPLYYAEVPGRLLFGSEIKSLLLDQRVARAPSPEAINYFLSHLWVPGPGTMFSGVSKLPPGHYMRWRAGRVDAP